jgi:hypothetical protein
MATAVQNYETHRHNPKAFGIGFLLTVIALVCFALRALGVAVAWTTPIGLLSLTFAVFVLLFTSRSYTTRLQDRIIKLEMRVRGSVVLDPAHRAAYERLGKAQQIALRFASNEELPGLIDRAEKESLPPDQIKRAIKNWVPDLDRT